jgi:DNA primase
LGFAQGFSEEDVLLQASIHAALEHAQSKPAALLHAIESKVDARLLHEIQLELALFVKGSEFELEFEGACTQLGRMIQKRQDGGVLDALKEKPLSAWTDEDRDMLKKLTVKQSSSAQTKT